MVHADQYARLDNLRYAFTSCLYGYPHQVANISSPCVVTCSSLQPALDQNIQNPSAYGFFEWCGSSAFTDVVATQCHECYNLTANQIYLGNCTFTSPIHSRIQWLTPGKKKSHRSHPLQLPLPHIRRRSIPHQPQRDLHPKPPPRTYSIPNRSPERRLRSKPPPGHRRSHRRLYRTSLRAQRLLFLLHPPPSQEVEGARGEGVP